MGEKVEFTEPTTPTSPGQNVVGQTDLINTAIARGKCPFCSLRAVFRQIGVSSSSDIHGEMVPASCDSCRSIVSIQISSGRVHPEPRADGIDDLPEDISEYYQESLDCLNAGAANGAMTLFRKVIHALALHYDIAEVDSSKPIYKMVQELDEAGHINPKLRKSLMTVKDLGNDGAHINENEPDLEQAEVVKAQIDAILNSTVVADQRIEYAREKHPNPHTDE